MSDDEADGLSPDEVSAELLSQMDDLEADETVDFEDRQRSEDGWIQFYVECPDCEVPMARTLVEDAESAQSDDVTETTAEVHAVCPECRAIASKLELTRITGPFDVVLSDDDS